VYEDTPAHRAENKEKHSRAEAIGRRWTRTQCERKGFASGSKTLWLKRSGEEEDNNLKKKKEALKRLKIKPAGGSH
jgi:hypothetical protein